MGLVEFTGKDCRKYSVRVSIIEYISTYKQESIQQYKLIIESKIATFEVFCKDEESMESAYCELRDFLLDTRGICRLTEFQKVN